MFNQKAIENLIRIKNKINKTLYFIKNSSQIKFKDKIIKSLEEKIISLDEQIYLIENNKINVMSNINQCKYMKRSCGCGRSNKDDVDKIKCTHPEVRENKAYIASRTSEKCSIPLNIPEEEGMQFCKYYEPMGG